MKYKAYLLIVYLFFFSVNFSYAQDSDSRKYVTLSQIAHLKTSSYSWSGAYIGLSLNYKFLTIKNKLEADPQKDSNSFLESIYTGFNMEINDHIVTGIEVGYNFGHCLFGCNADKNTLLPKRIGLMRTRFGYSFDNFLPFLAGGLVHARFNDIIKKERNSKVGWTIGGGLDYALTEGVILRAEYRYDNYGSVAFANAGIASSNFVGAKADKSFPIFSHNLNFGISYKF